MERKKLLAEREDAIPVCGTKASIGQVWDEKGRQTVDPHSAWIGFSWWTMWCVLKSSDKYHFEHVRSPSLIFLLHSIDGLAGLRPVSFRNPTAQRGGLIQPERQSTARRSLRASTTKWKCFTLWKVRNAEKIEPTKGWREACREQIMKFHIPLELFGKPEFPLTTDLPPSKLKDLQMGNGTCSSAWRDEASVSFRKLLCPYGCRPPSLDVGRSELTEREVRSW